METPKQGALQNRGFLWANYPFNGLLVMVHLPYWDDRVGMILGYGIWPLFYGSFGDFVLQDLLRLLLVIAMLAAAVCQESLN